MSALADLLRPHNQSELARKLGVPAKTVNRWARGHFSPDVAVLPKLAEVLAVDLAELTTIVAEDSKSRTGRVNPAQAVA
jgi:transcriptional regulator with XRE-family HTH domain